jgi:5-methylcytosine-specific restriction protein A
MTTQRRLTSADAVASMKGPHGNRQCRWCQKEVFPPRRTFCSEDCTNEWKLRSDVAFLRSQLFMRDKGICAHCQRDTLKLRREMWELSAEDRVKCGKMLGFSEYHSKKLMLWEADHVLPVSQGGGLTGLGNYQTLCSVCHLKKSLKERR